MTALIRLLSSTPFRLTLAYMGAFVAAAALIVGFIAWRANDLLTNKVVDTLEAEITGLREQFQAGGVERLAAVVSQRAAEPGASLYLLVDATGRKVGGNLDRVPPEFAAAGRGAVFTYARPAQERRGGVVSRLAVGVPVPVPGGLLLIVGRDIEDLHRFAGTMGQLASGASRCCPILGIGAGLAVSRSVLRRIETITDTSRTIMAGDLSKRIPLDGSGDELDRLSESLNGMLARIEELIVALREVSDNIAHDLKTPLNRLRNRAEAALANPDGAATYRDGLVKTIEEADDLIKTFNSLLLIAGSRPARCRSMGDVDPGSSLRMWPSSTSRSPRRLGSSCPPRQRPERHGQSRALEPGVANLVDNAIKYSAEAARTRDGRATRGRISWSGRRAIEILWRTRAPASPPQDRERALKRFVRLEKSRSRPGSGLGLSLVAAVARLHGGSIRLEDNAPGLRAVLALPIRSGSLP